MPFSVVKIDRTALLFPLVTSHAASHAVDAADRGHTGPVKNGDAFERLGLWLPCRHPQMKVCQSAERVGHTSLDIGATLSVQPAS